MPNLCSNSLYMSGLNEEAQNVIDSLLDGSIDVRTNEMVYKLRKLLLAGLSGLLHPHVSTDVTLLNQVGSLHSDLNTPSTKATPESLAYTEFLAELAGGVIDPERYEHINGIYERSKLGDKWYGDIPKPARRKLKALWKKCHYDYAGMFKSDIAKWWSKPKNWQPQQEAGFFDIQLMVELPINIMVNGFNGRLLNCSSEYDFNCNRIGIKWTTLEVHELSNGNWSFDTPWSPPLSLLELLPEFVAKRMNRDDPDDLVDITLYYYESGCAFQGINHECFDYVDEYNEETDEFESNLLPEIESAFM